MTDAVRLIVADDHTLFRQGLKSLLRRRREFQVVAEVERASELAQTLASTPCDVLLLDLQMERWAIDDIEQFSAVTKVLVLTASEQNRRRDLGIEDGGARHRSEALRD
jgi:DNA-binding NarL/FixJ family response regulator